MHAGSGPDREAAGRAAGGHRRRPLPVPGGRRRARRAVLHQHRQEARPEPAELSRRQDPQPVLRPLARRTCTSCSPDFADAVQRSQEIADGVDIDLDFKTRHFPVFTPPDKKTPEDYLRELCEQGLRRALRREPAAAKYVARLEHELGIICRMGFASYFLIVWDFVRFARENGIPCSARGSGVRGGRQLRPEAQPRRSARVRPALRALPRPEPDARRPTSTSTSARTAASR